MQMIDLLDHRRGESEGSIALYCKTTTATEANAGVIMPIIGSKLFDMKQSTATFLTRELL
jgi:hypothetical protein